jgi:hypothetical protein
MIVILCLPPSSPVTFENFNYSPIALGVTLLYALAMWFCSAKYWLQCANLLSSSEVNSTKKQQYAILPFYLAADSVNMSTSVAIETSKQGNNDKTDDKDQRAGENIKDRNDGCLCNNC